MRIWKLFCKVIGGAYELAWRRTIGRPFTYAIREWSHRIPGRAAAVIPVLVLGVLAFQVLSMLWLPMGIGSALVVLGDFCYFSGGHLWWDTAGEYIKSARHRRPGS